MRSALAQRLRAWAERDGRGYPDWATRYLPVLRRWGRPRGVVVEVGANENGLARFAGVRVITIDFERAQLEAARRMPGVLPVQADIAALPLRDGAADYVACLDVFEHLPPAVRTRGAQELARVLAPDGRGVMAFPCGAAAEAAEANVRAAYARYTGRTLRWLDEHTRHGLPDAAGVARALAEAAPHHTVTRAGNTNVRVWRWLWHVLLCGWPKRGNAVAQVAVRVLTPLISRAHFGVCYRAALWLEPRTRRSAR